MYIGLVWELHAPTNRFQVKSNQIIDAKKQSRIMAPVARGMASNPDRTNTQCL